MSRLIDLRLHHGRASGEMRLPKCARENPHNNASGSVQDERTVQPIRSIRFLLSGEPLMFAQSACGPRSNRLAEPRACFPPQPPWVAWSLYPRRAAVGMSGQFTMMGWPSISCRRQGSAQSLRDPKQPARRERRCPDCRMSPTRAQPRRPQAPRRRRRSRLTRPPARPCPFRKQSRRRSGCSRGCGSTWKA